MAELAAVEAMAHALMKRHLPEGRWAFGFDHARNRLALCDFTRMRITVSKPAALRQPLDEVEQHVLHEIAHAQVGLAVGHGARWLAAARAIGYRGGRTAPSPEGLREQTARWEGSCAAGHRVYFYRRPARHLVHWCASCRRAGIAAPNLRWRRRDDAELAAIAATHRQ